MLTLLASWPIAARLLAFLVLALVSTEVLNAQSASRPAGATSAPVRSLGLPGRSAGGASTWDGPKLTPTQRQDVFEFAAEPTFTPVRDDGGQAVPDRWVVRFASAGRCDVCIDILDGRGQAVRHLAYGVLGANAPPPFQPDRLDQAVVWDGKDDFGNYVREPRSCRARVRLGLAARWDKLLGWHPKNLPCTRDITAMSADPAGVFVLTGGGRKQLRLYSHEGRYLRTLIPFAADKIDAFKRADLTCVYKLPDGTLCYYPGSGPHEGGGPGGGYFGNHFGPPGPQRMAIADGRIALAGAGGPLTPRRLIRIRTDGSLDNGRFYGCYLITMEAQRNNRGDTPRMIVGPNALAASPDGRWLYVSGFDGVYQSVSSFTMSMNEAATFSGRGGSLGGDAIHAVYKVAWDKTEPGLGESFVGEAHRAGADPGHLNGPRDLAADPAGNLYVADTGNSRIQVFTPDAKLLRSIPITRPYRIDLDRKTGAIYVVSLDDVTRSGAVTTWRFRLVKLDADGRRRIEQAIEYRGNNEPLMCVDGWAPTPTVWLTHRPGEIALYADRSDRFELVHEFVKEVEQAGHIPFYVNDSWCGYLTADPTRPHLYLLSGGHGALGQLWRFDVETGRYALCRGYPSLGGTGGTGGLDDFVIGPTGLAYIRTTGALARVDPADNWKEVPLDYGEPVGKGLEGGIQFPWPPGLHFHMGLGVSPTGEILVSGFWGASAIIRQISIGAMLEAGDRRLQTDYKAIRRAWVTGALGSGAPPGALPPEDYYQPALYPGRPKADTNLICVWDAKGQPKLFDAIKGVPGPSSGIRGDREGNIYIGYAAQKYNPDGSLIFGRSLVKFAPAGGRFITASAAGARIPLDDPPPRPPEFRGVGSNQIDLWTRGLLWSYGGVNVMAENGKCICPNSRFDVDWYGRVFAPEAHRNSVAVLDTNGNFALRIGRYGNTDSGRGPDSPIPVGGDEIALSHCTYLASDAKGNWLYLNDNGNDRIVRVKLDYHRQAVAEISDKQ